MITITKLVTPDGEAWYYNNKLVYDIILPEYNTWWENVQERLCVILTILSCMIRDRSLFDNILWTTIETDARDLFPEKLEDENN